MKKLITILLFLLAGATNAQTLISNDFTSYDGTISTVKLGWTYSWNCNAPASSGCIDVTGTPISGGPTNYCGTFATCPSYKFYVDSANNEIPYVQTEQIPVTLNVRDTLTFKLYGIGTLSPTNYFEILESTFQSFSSYTTVDVFNSIAIGGSGVVHTYLLKSTTKYVRFRYHKINLGTNVVIDDIFIKKGVNTTGIDEENLKLNFSLYPNPMTNSFTIQLDSKFKNSELDIYNLVGELVYHSKISSENETFDPKLNPGIFFVKVSDDEKMFTQKLIVQ